MNKKYLSFITLFLMSYVLFPQAGIKGKVLDESTGEVLPFVNVIVEKNGVQVTGTATDFDGEYFIKPLEPGTYTIKSSFTGYKSKQVNGIKVNSEKITFFDIKMNSSISELEEFVVEEYTVPLVSKDNTTAGAVVTKEDILKMPTRSVTGVAQTVGGVYSKDDGEGDLNIRGSRSDANYYFIDGIKVRGSTSIPKASIEEVNVMVGGVPAQYGDIIGGIISVTTKGPSSTYFGSVEYLTSGWKTGDNVVGLDAYGYNLLEGSVSGPLLMKKDEKGNKTKPLLGFFLSANFIHQIDQRPSPIGNWNVKQNVLDDLSSNPLRYTGTGSGTYQNSLYLKGSDFQNVKTRLNNNKLEVNLTGKLDVSVGKGKNLTFGGTFNRQQYKEYQYTRSLLNWDEYPEVKRNDWRVFGRFVQNFTNNDQNKSKNQIKRAYYLVQVDFSQNNYLRWNANHKDNLWDYGYVGEFKSYKTTTFTPKSSVTLYNGKKYGYDKDTVVYNGVVNVLNGFGDQLIGFKPGDKNSKLAAYTSKYYELYGWEGYDSDGNPVYDAQKATGNSSNPNFYLSTIANITSNGGLINGFAPPLVYGIWSNHASPWDNYRKRRRNQFRFSSNGSVDIKDHSIMAGFEYEQRVDREYSVFPSSLWTIGRLRANSHIANVNEFTDSLVFTSSSPVPLVYYDRLNSSPGKYNALNSNESQSFFDYNLRKELGLNPDGVDWVDFNSISPDKLRVDFFSADELLNNGNGDFVNYYYGYDVWGNIETGSPTVDDFFNARDKYGNRTRPIGAFRPVYMAGYVQDKFTFEDLVFNIGVRVDRYDANQSVLKDPYVLFPTVKAGEDEAKLLTENGNHPGNIGDDYVVYVDDLQNPTKILGYRNEDIWYNSQGVEITNPSLLETSSGTVIPLLEDKNKRNSIDITSKSFKDYVPQTNFMPRIGFSFAISEESIFSAHYDILTKRPTKAARLNILDYMFLNQIPSDQFLNNPDLKSEKTIDYAIGFQQKLSNSSSVKVETFYRELRDQVQAYGYQQAFPRGYLTYKNRDFGTVKGLTVSYDLRRTSNFSLRAFYTLQFAEGTGSSPTSGVNLIRAGRQNLRNITPLTYDQRHTISATADYRFGGGKNYNGPLKLKKILESAGVNFQISAGSGVPYSKQRYVTGEGFTRRVGSSILQGSVNGARLPWQYRVDMRLDKNINIRNSNSKKDPFLVNVYLQVFNLFNLLNINYLYRATGNSYDDGYLSSAIYHNDVISQVSEQSFRNYYSMKINDQTNYNLPRRVRIGALVNF